MRRVVVTGLGIVSSLGNNSQEVLQSLKDLKSGVCFNPEYEQIGFRSNVCGLVDVDWKSLIDRKKVRFMGQAAGYAYLALEEALKMSGLFESDLIKSPRAGIIAGSGGGSNQDVVESADIARSKKVKMVGPYRVTRAMGNTVSACLATFFGIQGVNYSISSACSTSAHCIGNAYEMIQFNKQDIMLAGGAEELHWAMSVNFDAMGALSSNFNDNPSVASRAFDKDRDGFVISGGGGMVVLEEYEHAKKRGAPILAELVGYGATSDGYDMVQPSGDGAVRCMQQALSGLEQNPDYINAHGTSTPIGDIREMEAVKKVFGTTIPTISSTKSLSGHALGAAGANEAIYTLLAMQEGFIIGSAHIDHLDDALEGLPIALENQDKQLNVAMSNSFGFGGTNASLVFKKV